MAESVFAINACLCLFVHCVFLVYKKCTSSVYLTLVLQVSTHNMHSSSEDDDMEGPFPNDLSLQQVAEAWMWPPPLWRVIVIKELHRRLPTVCDGVPLSLQAFSDYQIQQMTANFVDQFGFNDEEFSEHDENIK